MSSDSFASLVSQVWLGQMPFPDLVQAASELGEQGSLPLAAVLYQTWLQRTISPYSHAVEFNLGAALATLGDLVGSEAAYRRAIALSPTFTHPRLNLGLTLERQGRIDEAISEWRWIADNGPRDEANRSVVVYALNHLGRVYETRKLFHDAIDVLTQSLMIDPQQPDVLHHWVFERQKVCVWPVLQELPGVSVQAMFDATSALAMLSVTDDPVVQLQTARRYVQEKLAKDLPALSQRSTYGHRKIRIGYASSDFSLHPVSMLTVQLFELHNRDLCEVYGYCWSPEDGSALRQRVKSAMDQFHRIDQLSDEQAARLIRSHEIDVLIDLQGQTAGARPNLLGYRPAPIQMTYLGLPATTGFPFIDFVIADTFLIPPELVAAYSEKPLYMPHIYQASDQKRVSGTAPARASCGLPEQGFVFCSFNNNYKYTPAVFERWCNILRRVPGSVLWLLADNPWAEKNLRAEAERRGIDAARLVFAPRASPEQYLARYLTADLFLDTYPFNAGTTANDCLWMGCPLLTLTGRAFASRMAGAMLVAAGLSNMITHNLDDYEEAAVRLALDPQSTLDIRQHLAGVRASGALFDTPQFVRDLDERLVRLVRDLPAPARSE